MLLNQLETIIKHLPNNQLLGDIRPMVGQHARWHQSIVDKVELSILTQKIPLSR